MIRPFMVISIILVFLLASTVFQVEQYVQSLRGELVETNRQLKENLDELHVLKAEWAYLTHPNKLEILVRKYLKTELASVAQIKDIDSISGSAYATLDKDTVKFSKLEE